MERDTVCAEVKEGAESTVLDPRTYHVFRHRDKSILYDVRTGLIAEITDPFTYDVLDVCGRADLDGVVSELRSRHGEVARDRVLAKLDEFVQSGLFRMERRDPSVLQRIKHVLLTHQPRRIQLFVAQACNMECIYCYAGDNGSNDLDRLMTFEMAKQAVDHLVERSRRRPRLTVQFFGGEPLMNYDVIKQVVEYTKALEETTGKTFSFQISTNGTLLTEEVQNFIVENDMGTLVSLDGDEDTQNRQRPMRGGGPSYGLVVDKAIELDRKFCERGKLVMKIRANIVGGPEVDPIQVSGFLESLGFTYIGISAIFARPGEENAYSYTETTDRRWRERSDWMFRDWLEKEDRGERRQGGFYARQQVGKTLQGLGRSSELGMIHCGVGRNTNAVDTEGNIFPCHRYVGLDEYILGNVKTGLDQAKVEAYYDVLINNVLTACGDCWTRAKCGGPCPWEVSRTDGTIEPPKEEECASIKHGVERAMYLYVCLAQRHPERLKAIMGDGTTILAGPKEVTAEDADAEERDA